MINVIGFLSHVRKVSVLNYIRTEALVHRNFFIEHSSLKYQKGFLIECNFSKHDIKMSNPFINDVCRSWLNLKFRPPKYNMCSN